MKWTDYVGAVSVFLVSAVLSLYLWKIFIAAFATSCCCK